MLRTKICDLLGIDVPIILAPFGPWEEVELAAAVSDAGALGSLGTAVRTKEELATQWTRLAELTSHPFAINHTGRPFNEEAFAATLEFRPKAISFHMGVVPDLIKRAHDAGIIWIQTVGDSAGAEQALKAGADVLIAQGTEAGGNAGWIATMVLVPAVVDLAGSVPVVAAGGIGDGRGIAASLVLGAQGVSMGTRFLATPEMRIDESWKRRIVEAGALDTVKVPHSERVMPPFNVPQSGKPFAPRVLRTPLVERLETSPESVDPASVGPELLAAVRIGGGHDLLPFTGQSAELIREILPAGEIVSRLVREAEEALETASRVIDKPRA